MKNTIEMKALYLKLWTFRTMISGQDYPTVEAEKVLNTKTLEGVGN